MMTVRGKGGAESLQNQSAWEMWWGWWRRISIYRYEAGLQPVDKAVSTHACFFFWGGQMPDARPGTSGSCLATGSSVRCRNAPGAGQWLNWKEWLQE